MTMHFGDNINQIGDHNSVIKHQGGGDLLTVMEAFRARVPAADRESVDSSLAVLREHGLADEPARQALRTIAGVAAMLGDTPVIDAIRSATETLGRLRDG
ncbi:hypothetical protein [Actinokineospora sp. UTMC 2448]|uniref:hypothetical protein n=1 Tax=Actinokineospora sp. UTMC 2448 TaxID=2268449 RepID=UPI0021648EEC|nr:hypothetical protein [Actinokineospora sp. UTMC 2448]UVS76967.1 hypothetical protein Actkin_00665 [Actinokineospora sp. UTMC 2448]